MANALPSPPPSPSPAPAPAPTPSPLLSSFSSTFPSQEEPQFRRKCLGCSLPLIWRQWSVQDSDHGRWYTYCDLREDDCDWFRWAFEDSDVLDIPQSPPPRTSSSHKRKRSPSIEVSSPFPAKRKHSPSIEISSPRPTSEHVYDQQIAPLLYARHRTSTSYGLSKINLASSLPPERSSTSSTEHPQPPRVWPFDFYANEMDIGFKTCRLESNKQRPVEKVFVDQFHVKFVRSTYYDHRRHWMSVSHSVRERYIGYGQTERGRWSTFIRQEIRGERQMGQR